MMCQTEIPKWLQMYSTAAGVSRLRGVHPLSWSSGQIVRIYEYSVRSLTPAAAASSLRDMYLYLVLSGMVV